MGTPDVSYILMATPAVHFIPKALWEPLLLALYWWQYRNPQYQLYTDIVMATPAVSYTLMALWEPLLSALL